MTGRPPPASKGSQLGGSQMAQTRKRRANMDLEELISEVKVRPTLGRKTMRTHRQARERAWLEITALPAFSGYSGEYNVHAN